MPDDKIAFKLFHPITVMDEKVDTLTFRPPTTREIIQHGNPVIFDPISEPAQVRHDYAKMADWVSRLAGIPVSSVAFIDHNDLVSIAWAVSPFFLPRIRTA